MSQDSKPREITLSIAVRGDVLGLLALEGGATLRQRHYPGASGVRGGGR